MTKRSIRSPIRVQIVEPEWIRDPRAWPGPVILPEEYRKTLAPRRLLLSAKELARQLGCDRSLVRAWLRVRGLHEASEGEKKANAGLCSEDLAALSLTGLLIREFDCPLKTAAKCFRELLDELLNAVSPARTLLAILVGNRATEFRVTTSVIPGDFLVVDQMIQHHMHVYDASALRNRIEECMDRTPLSLPTAESVKIQA